MLWFIWTGKNRFNALTRELPQVNQGVLMRVLRDLESDGLVTRKEHGKRPAPVEYFLTDQGLSLGPVLALLAQWGRANGTPVQWEEKSAPQR